MVFNSFKQYIIAGAAIVLASCGGSDKSGIPQGPPPPTPVTVTEVQTTDAVYYDEYPATLSALNQTDLRSQVTGYITGVYFQDGQKVSKGQKLYSIDAQIYDANYQQSIANLQVQETNMMKAQKDADRYHELDKHDAIAKQQVDYADASLEAAKKQVAAARAVVNSVRANVSFSTITAPFTGTIGISGVKTGTAVVAGQTILNTVSTDNPIAVDFAVDQKEIYRFVQMQQKQNAKDSTFLIAFGTDIYPYPGSISLIDRAVDPQTGTIKTRLVFPNDKGMLKPGMNTSVRIKNSSAQQSIIIPNKAISEQLGEFFVYVVGDSSKVTQRKVALGKQIGTNIIVKDGLKQGEKIVVEGIQKLREGAVITTAPPKAPDAKK
ncbi:MAG: efflux RND transporter periplasmic adaptor subunit [Bacteroidota bacterium]